MEIHRGFGRGSIALGLQACVVVGFCAGCGGVDPTSLSDAIETTPAELRDRTKPTTPTNLRVTAATSYSVSLAWNPASDNSGSFSYRIRHSWGYEETVPQTQTSFTWTTHLEAGSSYSFHVYAVDAAGNVSRNSNTVNVQLARDTSPPSIPVVVVSDVGPTHVTLAYASTDDGPYIWYSVFKNGVAFITLSRETPGTAYFLEPETTYTFTAQARDFGGNRSALSSPLAVTTSPVNPNDTTPPSVPTNLYEDHASDGEINLHWTASTDDFELPAFIRYDIYVNGVLDDIAVGGRTRSIVYGVDGTNTIAVTAKDSAGNVSAPATVTIVLDL